MNGFTRIKKFDKKRLGIPLSIQAVFFIFFIKTAPPQYQTFKML